jgi:hypothetical protein
MVPWDLSKKKSIESKKEENKKEKTREQSRIRENKEK